MGTFPPSHSIQGSRDVPIDPWDMGQRGCPHQDMGCGTMRMFPPSHGVWGSRDVPTDVRDLGQQGCPHQAIRGRAAGMSPLSPEPCPAGFPAMVQTRPPPRTAVVGSGRDWVLLSWMRPLCSYRGPQPRVRDCHCPSPSPERVLGQGTNPGGQILLLPHQARCRPHRGTPGPASVLPRDRR